MRRVRSSYIPCGLASTPTLAGKYVRTLRMRLAPWVARTHAGSTRTHGGVGTPCLHVACVHSVFSVANAARVPIAVSDHTGCRARVACAASLF